MIPEFLTLDGKAEITGEFEEEYEIFQKFLEVYLKIPSRKLLRKEYEIDVKDKTPKQVV
ncbi:hypothetical protein [Paenibacillus pseudetheri]|uniref:hypothetical protein n=1 Tax=Paenibacillus pseudetheri TaxID=2897682 RepID=UPI001F15EFF4|nr:hypothetical protein [Paenibacillus pseudetheri]